MDSHCAATRTSITEKASPCYCASFGDSINFMYLNIKTLLMLLRISDQHHSGRRHANLKINLRLVFTFSSLAIAGILLLTISACRNGHTRPEVTSTTVELDIFSGLPNPTWTLEPVMASDLITRIARLNSTSEMVECPQNLGYRGFIVRFLDAGSSVVRTVRTCDGKIAVIDATGSKYYLDPQKEIELWLLATSDAAQPPLSADFIAQIITEINAP